MFKSGYAGRVFEFENTFFNDPEEMGFLKVWQIGELSSEPGFEMATHVNPCHEISYVISGNGFFYSDGIPILAQQGDIHVIPAGKTHRIVANPNQKLRFAYIGWEFNFSQIGEEFKDLCRTFENPPTHLVRDVGDVRQQIYMLISEMYNKPIYNNIMVECYIKQILVIVYRLLVSAYRDLYVPEKSKKIIGHLVYSITRYIDSNIQEITSIKGIAEALGYSHSYLSHKFREEMGTTMQSYVNKKKVETCLELLKYKRMSVTQIAMLLNYESVQSFGKVFKKIMGCSPSEYQKKHKEETE